jgi:succinate dehydrogenase / fumarate reductase cytochrome b subunit
VDNSKKRPINLYLPGIRLPVGGVVSILHRISGVLLVLSLPAVILLLQQSLASPGDYVQVAALLKTWPIKLLLLLAAVLFVHHLLAGVRHLLLDIDIGISRRGGRRGAWLVLAGVAGAALLTGGLLYQ